MDEDVALPQQLEDIVRDFADAPPDLRVEMLFEFSEKVPALPAHLAGDREAMEQVVECQAPFFLSTEVSDGGAVRMWFECPPEAPTTRGFAGILSEGLRGATIEQVLGVPDDFYLAMGLGEAISPLRLRGMSAILRRLKRQLVRSGAAA